MKSSMVALSIAMAAVLVGCSNESTAPKSIAYVGTYSLVRVNDAKLPVLYFGAGDNSDLMITGGTFTLQADNSFTDTVYLSQSSPATGVKEVHSMSANGTYTVIGSRLAITLTNEKNSRYYLPSVGEVEAENLNVYLSVVADGKLFLYRKTP